jgi:tetratricopeptide (TPR) repeat protein
MLAAAGAVAAVTITAHSPAWRGAFVSDDISEIAENPAIRVLWPPRVPMFEGTPMPHRPLPYYTFALNYAVHGLDPRGYHAVNLAIHLANGWLAWWVAREILRRLGAGEAAGGIALAAATLWLVHPLGTQAVDYVYQRIESLGATAILGTVACFLQATRSPRPDRWLAASVVTSAAGMLCKEHVIAAPVAVVLVDWLAVRWRREAPWRSLSDAVAARPAFSVALFATPLVAVGLVLAQRDRFTDFRQPLAGPLLYAANQPLVIGEYLQRAVWPARLCIDWYRLPVTSPALLAPGIAAAAGALGLAAWGVRHARGPALGILLFLVLLAPTSSFLPVNDLMVEHRMYLPLFVVCLGSCAVARGILAGFVAAGWRQPAGITLAAVAAAALAVTTWHRCHAYQSRLVMWADVVTRAPGNPRGWQTLALELFQLGDSARALEAVDRSLALVPQAPMSHLTRAGILLDLGRPGEAIAAADRTLALDPAIDGARRVRAAAVKALQKPGDAPRTE